MPRRLYPPVTKQVHSAELGFLLRVVAASAVELSCHPYGCRVVQRVMERCTDEDAAPIVDAVLASVPRLIGDQYGNYVLQHILEYGPPQHKAPVFVHVLGRVVPLATHKYASNIVERCLQFGAPAQRIALVEEVVAPSFDTFVAMARRLPADPRGTPLQVLVASPFGNFVVQRMIDCSTDRLREALLDMLWSYAATLKRYTYGRHILSRLDKLASADAL